MQLGNDFLIRLFADPVCAICLQPERIAGRSLSVDHDHRCCDGCEKCVRGLLCHGCNVGIGNLMDSPELLRKAAEYLEKSQRAVSSAL